MLNGDKELCAPSCMDRSHSAAPVGAGRWKGAVKTALGVLGSLALVESSSESTG